MTAGYDLTRFFKKQNYYTESARIRDKYTLAQQSKRQISKQHDAFQKDFFLHLKTIPLHKCNDILEKYN